MSLELQEQVCTGHEALGVMKEVIKARVPWNTLWQILGAHIAGPHWLKP